VVAHTQDLAVEVSDLAHAVALRLGPVRELAYPLDAAPHHVPAGEGQWAEFVELASQDLNGCW
jgi:hypothetical protein